MTPLHDRGEPPAVRLQGSADGHGRLYQAVGDQTLFQITQHPPRCPLPEASTVQVPFGLAGLPRRPAATFVGREQALTELQRMLQSGPGTGMISQTVVGLGGVGKSELALQYAVRHRGTYRLVWWVEADKLTQIQAGLAALTRELVAGVESAVAQQATPEEAAAWALAWLNTHTGWLLIFDNLEEIADIEPYLSRLAKGHLLITTRRDIDWRQRIGVNPLRLDLLQRTASVALLAELIGPSATNEGERLDELAEQLGDLPLALTQAGAYINHTPQMTPARYLRLLRDAPARMLAAVPAGVDPAQAMAKTWVLSRERLDTVSPLAVHLLGLLACYAPESLPCTVLEGLNAVDGLAVDEALALLASYTLITVTSSPDSLPTGRPEDLISMHRLVQATILHGLADDERTRLRRQAADLLQAACPATPEALRTWDMYRRLLPHACAVLAPDSPGLRQVLRYLHASGDHANALAIQRRMHTHYHRTAGPDHPDTLIARANLAFYTGKVGSVAAARDELARVLLVIERVLGTDHPDTLATRHELARWTGEAGEAAAARDQYAQLLPVSERIMGAEHPDTLTTRQRLGDWTGQAGDSSAARDHYAALLPTRERVLGPHHPDTLSTRHQIARWTGEAGDFATARDQCAALLPLRKAVLGEHHPDTLATRASIAYWTGRAGDAAAARDQYAALVALRERTVGQHHPDTLTTRANLARWTGEAGNAAAARDQYATLVVLRERVLGKDHPDTLTAQTGLARWMGKAGDAAAARDHYTALLPALQRVRGPDHPETLAARGNLAYSAGKAGDAVTARDQYAALLPAITRIQGAEHPDTLTIRHNLARWTGEAGDASTARDQLAELLPIRERLLGTRHPDTQSTQASLLHWTARAG
ncbi:tetratricopeptide repeat protein [Nonomuraea fuscirosea]